MPKAQRKPLLGKKHITDHKFLLTLLAITLVGLSVLALNWNLSYKSRAAGGARCKIVRGQLTCAENRNAVPGSTEPGVAASNTCARQYNACRKDCSESYQKDTAYVGGNTSYECGGTNQPACTSRGYRRNDGYKACIKSCDDSQRTCSN
jgi:hypothetical protein